MQMINKTISIEFTNVDISSPSTLENLLKALLPSISANLLPENTAEHSLTNVHLVSGKDVSITGDAGDRNKSIEMSVSHNTGKTEYTAEVKVKDDETGRTDTSGRVTMKTHF